MLNKITIDNFKSLKHLEYDCAGLNLLTGLNGAGKSSFIQVMEVLRHVAKRGLKSYDTFSLADIGHEGKLADLRNCYSDPREDVEVKVDYKWRNIVRDLGNGRKACTMRILDHSCEDGDEPRFPDVQSITRIMRDGNGKVSVLHPALRDEVLSSSTMKEFINFVQENGGERAIENEPFDPEERPSRARDFPAQQRWI